MADPLSVAASVTGLLTLAATALTKGYAILRSLQGSSKEVERLLTELSQLTGLLCALSAQKEQAERTTEVEGPRNAEISQVLESSLNDCRKTMKKLQEILEKLEKSRKAILAIKWQFWEPEINKMIQEIARYRQIFALCLGVDLRRRTEEMLDLQTEISLQLLDMKDEHEKEKMASQEESVLLARKSLFQWLVPKSNERHAKAAKLGVPGTGEWLLEHPEFISWAKGDGSLLWLHGMPGSGKTVLMSQVIEYLQDQPPALEKASGIAYFYFAYNEAESISVSQILSSLTAQIIRYLTYPEAGPAMDLFRECDDGTLAASSDKMRDLIILLIKELQTVYICLDALDECSTENKDEMLSLVMVLIEKCSNVKILVSSRTGDTKVREYLDFSPDITVTAGALAQDIDLYVRHRIKHGPERLKRAASEYMVERLVNGAEGMFLWASCQMDQLSLLTSPAGVESALSSLPRGLYGTYNRILLDIPPEHEFLAARTLKWLALAASPLTLAQLVEAVAVEDHNTCLNALQRLYVPEDIFQICGSLIRHSESTGLLTLAHHSVYEFLTSTDTRSRIPRSYYIPSGQSMVDLTTTCLAYLSFKDFSLANMQSFMGLDPRDTSTVGAVPIEDFAERAFYDYALRYWFHHLPTSEEGIEQVWPFLEKFFDSDKGNFESSILVLRHLEGAYKYPVSMKPVHFCATHGLSLVMNRLLVENMTDVECRVEDGRRPVHMAAENGREETVKHLLGHVVDVNSKTADGRTPLQLAMESGNEAVARLLISAGVDFNANLAHGETALSLAVVNRWRSLAEFLLQSGADPNGRLVDGRAPLHVAATVGSDCDMLNLLLDAGASSDLREERGLTPLHLAAYYGHREAAIVLMERPGVDRYFNVVEWTPLHYAVREEHLNVIRLFHRFVYPVSTTLMSAYRSPRLEPLSDHLSASKRDPVYRKGELDSFAQSRGDRKPFPKYGTAGDVPRGSGPGLEERIQDDANRRATPKLGQVPTPLLLATWQGFLPGIKVLIDAGVTVADRERCKKYAAAKGLNEVLEHIISCENPVIPAVAEFE